ncbi:MAG TPA: DUF5050 domain-containing protein [Fimbriimonadaceae bacterium]|nr:DUF5050 domain-containing protein [Fimbriimonadaceae bacterium]
MATGSICIGCGGVFGGSSFGTRGVLFYRADGNNWLYRISTNGGGTSNVAGTINAFEASMDQDFNVYTSFLDNNITRVTNGTSIELTSSGNDFRPCVTPDGTRIAFVSHRDGNDEVYTMNGDGSSQTNVSNDAGIDTFAAISRDGSKVVFTSNRDGNDEIYIVDFDGSNLTRLTNNAADDATPAFTPDGTHVIFSSNRSGTYQIYSMDTTGGNVTQLTTSAEDKFHPSFKVDGTVIVYYTATGGATRQLWRCNADGTGEVQLTTDVHGADKMASWVY